MFLVSAAQYINRNNAKNFFYKYAFDQTLLNSVDNLIEPKDESLHSKKEEIIMGGVFSLGLLGFSGYFLVTQGLKGPAIMSGYLGIGALVATLNEADKLSHEKDNSKEQKILEKRKTKEALMNYALLRSKRQELTSSEIISHNNSRILTINLETDKECIDALYKEEVSNKKRLR